MAGYRPVCGGPHRLLAGHRVLADLQARKQRLVSRPLDHLRMNVEPTTLADTPVQQQLRSLPEDWAECRDVQPCGVSVVAKAVPGEDVAGWRDSELVVRIRLGEDPDNCDFCRIARDVRRSAIIAGRGAVAPPKVSVLLPVPWAEFEAIDETSHSLL